MKKILVILPLIILYFVLGCKKEDSVLSFVSFRNSTVEVPATQTEYGISVTSNVLNWTLTKDDKSTWVKILGNTSRDTSSTIYIEMEKNLSLDSRTAEFTLSFHLDSAQTRTLKLTQLGEVKAILVGIDTLFMPAIGGISLVKVNSNLAWQAVTSLPFITVESDGLTKTMVEKNLKLNFSENKSLGFRVSNITVKEKDTDVESNFVAYQFGVGKIETDSLALIDLYNATGGVNWTKTWDLTKPIKSWDGVTLKVTQDGVRVSQLDLSNNNLVGTIPQSISNISYLEEIALQENKLSGAIPPSIGSLHLLKYLYLYDNELTGVIPSELAKASFLDRIHLGRNQLSGSIPIEFGELKYLKIFGVESNNLTGGLPEKLGESTKLQVIYVYDNRLNGNIPDTYMKNISWKNWNVKIYVCPQQNGFGFNNCPR